MKLEIALEYGFLIRVTTNRKVDFRPVTHTSRRIWHDSAPPGAARNLEFGFWILLDLGDVESVPGHHKENSLGVCQVYG